MPARDLVADVMAGFGLLTRLPVRVTSAPDPGAVWAWPLIGAAVGALAAAAAGLGMSLGLAPAVAAVLLLTVEAMATGGLHEDGLADCADGFWGGQTPARRLEIMKDSRVGSYGVLALGLVLLARWAALTALLTAGDWGAVIAAAAMSRAPMALVMALLPNARAGGLSASHGAPAVPVAVAGAGLALVLGALGAGVSVLAMALAMAASTLAVMALARAKIGGQTGDVLGAAQQLALVAGLAFA